MSKLSEFLDKNKIAHRRLLSASHQAERLLPEDRAIRLARQRNRAGKASEGEKQLAEKKPRSGRPVTARTLGRAVEGERISGPAKTRITRAVNYVLEQKKKDKVDFRELF